MKKDMANKGKPGFSFLTKKEDQVEETPQVEEGGEPESDEEGQKLTAEEEAEQDEAKAEAEGEAALTKEEVQGEDSQEEEGEKEPEWLETVLEGTGGVDPSGVTDKALLKIKGIGRSTLKQIREIYPYEKPKPVAKGKVMIRVLPMRGIGGVGKAGTEAEMEREQAEQYVQDGYVEILE